MFFNSTRKLNHTFGLGKTRYSDPKRDSIRSGASDGDGRFARGAPLGFPLLLLLFAFFLVATLSAQDSRNSIEVPGGLSLLLKAKGEGVQIYGCVNGTWQLQTPAADLLDDHGRTIGRHYSGPTWELNDGSLVKGAVVSKQASPEAMSIPWLLLKSSGATGKLETVQFIQRSETHGGVAPSGTCTEAATIRIPYSALYSFYGRAR
jgi:hypothetical protein